MFKLLYKKLNVLTLLLTVFLTLAMTHVDAQEQLPAFSSQSLTGVSYSFPQSLKKPYTAVIVAFSPKKQNEVNQWLAELKPLASQNNRFTYYELPVMDSKYKVSKSVIETFMKKTVPDKATQQRIIPVFTDLNSFSRSLSISNKKDIHIVLVDQTGTVLWSTVGALSKDKLNQLIAAIK